MYRGGARWRHTLYYHDCIAGGCADYNSCNYDNIYYPILRIQETKEKKREECKF